MGILAIFTFALWFTWIIRCDGKERPSVPSSVWIVVAWLFIHSTRPASVWLGLSVGGSRDEGNPVEAGFNLILILAGVAVLWRRGTQLPIVIRDNSWLFVLYLFWLLSVGWSDYPLITFKRLFKEMGNVIMVLVILTDRNPSDSIRATCVRLAYLCIPLSIILIRYFPDWGRTFAGYHRNIIMYTGVAMQKNVLGVLVLVSALFLLWDHLELSGKSRASSSPMLRASRILVLLQCWYLLVLLNSVTSLVSAMVGSVLLLLLGRPSFRQRAARMEAVGLSVVAVLALSDWMFNIKEKVLEAFGRDMTLTTRTEIWAIVGDYQDNPLGGQGFDTFWAGRRLEELADKTFGVIQAHNGYIETYLNGGLIGVCLLVVLLLTSYIRIRKKLAIGNREDCVRLTILLTALVHNYAEASFNKIGILWFVTLYAIMEYRSKKISKQSFMSPVYETNGPIGVTPISAQARNKC